MTKCPSNRILTHVILRSEVTKYLGRGWSYYGTKYPQPEILRFAQVDKCWIRFDDLLRWIT